jgi:protease-4
VAEPTVLTGSIGVVMRYLVFQELLESKLGIRPVVQTEGQKKDWPSSFRQPKDEEIQYLREKVILPAYERFIEVVAEGRQASLTMNEVRGLADGGIFGAREAADKKLIDQIGYLDDAIKLSKSLAGIEDARVVEYHRVFSLSSLLSAKSDDALNLGLNVLQQFRTPQVLYLWSSY